MIILEARGLTKTFGGLTAVSDLSFGMKKGEILGIIGPNGAGKTTLFNLITGFYHPTQGTVFFKGKRSRAFDPMKSASEALHEPFSSPSPLRT
jgi:branched-chain amino acid transport system ATP-binding protein